MSENIEWTVKPFADDTSPFSVIHDSNTSAVAFVNNVYVPFRVGGVFPWLVKINNIHNIQLLLIKLVVHYIGHY